MNANHAGARRILGMGLASCALVVVLAGCTADYPVAARIVDSHLTFVVCDTTRAQRIAVLVVDPGPDDPNPPTYWQVDGDDRVWSDEPILYGKAPDGFDTVIAPRELPTDESRILIFVDTLNDADEVVWRVGGNYVANSLSDQYWLQTGGEHSSEPCN